MRTSRRSETAAASHANPLDLLLDRVTQTFSATGETVERLTADDLMLRAEPSTCNPKVAASLDHPGRWRRVWLPFCEVDVLVTAVVASSPPPIDQEGNLRDLVRLYIVPHDLAGVPTCTVRAGFDALGIPIGLQLTGPPWGEGRVLAAAQELYDALDDVQDVGEPVGAGRRARSAARARWGAASPRGPGAAGRHVASARRA